MKKRILFPLLGTLLTVSLLTQDVNLLQQNIVLEQNDLTEVAEDINNHATRLIDARLSNEGVVSSEVFVQSGEINENEYAIRFAVAVKNASSISFLRHVDGAEDKVKEVENVYKCISANDQTYYYDGNSGLVTEDVDSGYYFACYTVVINKTSSYLNKLFTLTPTVNGEVKASLSVSFDTLKSNNVATASFYDEEKLIARTMVEKGEVVEYLGNEYKEDKRIGSWTKGETKTEWLGKLTEDTSFVANYYDVISLNTAEDLVALDTAIKNGETSNKYYIQTANLDVTSMLGHGEASFEGVLDGNGYEFNLNLSTTSDFYGFIASNSGLLKNVKTTGSVTSTKKWVAGLCVRNKGYIVDSLNDADVHSDVAEVGGLTCYNYGSIYSSTNKGDVDGTYTVGGIVGFNIYDATVNENPIILSCTNEGKIYSNAYEANNNATSTTAGFWVGGIVGTNHLDSINSKKLTIESCVNSGEVRGSGGIRSTQPNDRNCAGVGGIIGANWQATISNCENTGDVRGYHYFGGIAGTAGGAITNSVNRGFINGNVETSSNTSTYQGGIVGFTALGLLENNNNYGDVRGYTYLGGIAGCLGSATAAVESKNCNNYGQIYTSAGTNNNSHSIAGIVGYLGAYHTLTDCDNAGIVKGIGRYDENNEKYEGVGGIAGTVLKNVIISLCDNTGDITAVRSAGGIAGVINGEAVLISNCTNDNSFLSRSTNNQINIGGIFGHTIKSGLTVENCNSVMSLSFESSKVTSAICVGTLGGKANSNPTVTNCSGNIVNSPLNNVPEIGTSTSITIVK